MSLALRLTIALVGAGVGGGVAGLVAAVLVLQTRVLRNHVLARRGEAGIRDCILPTAFVPFGALGGLVVAGVLLWFVAPVPAALIGALVPAALLLLISVGNSIAQLAG